jgi:hypothetical protein
MIAQLIGGTLGELVAGPGSDALMNWRSSKTGTRLPEYRLPIIYPGFILSIAGFMGKKYVHFDFQSTLIIPLLQYGPFNCKMLHLVIGILPQ